MELTQIKVGMVVKSMAGHDGGSFYAVMLMKDGFAYIADGRERTVEKPKKKSPKHLSKTNITVDTEGLTNKQLRAALHDLNFRANNICKESE